jgi:hypothetical protein
MISVICVYNNREILDNYLLKSLKDQTKDYELILIDNTKNKFKSAAEALNYGGNKAKEKYLMFVHQDINLCSNKFLEELQVMLNVIPDLGIAGVAGKLDKRTITNIKQGSPPKNAGYTLNSPLEVQTLDECLFIIPKNVFDKLKFDEEVCSGWHLYAVDYSLSVKMLNFKIFVLPLFLYHKSYGYSFSDDYYSILKKLLNKHKKNYKNIYTTMGDWNSSYPLFFQKITQK